MQGRITKNRIEALRRMLLGPALYKKCGQGEGAQQDDLNRRLIELKNSNCVTGDCSVDDLVKMCSLKESMIPLSQTERMKLVGCYSGNTMPDCVTSHDSRDDSQATRSFSSAYGDALRIDDSEGFETCSICLDDLVTDESEQGMQDRAEKGAVVSLDCNHSFHANCVAPAVRKRTCPICRKEMTDEEVSRIMSSMSQPSEPAPGAQPASVLEQGLRRPLPQSQPAQPPASGRRFIAPPRFMIMSDNESQPSQPSELAAQPGSLRPSRTAALVPRRSWLQRPLVTFQQPEFQRTLRPSARDEVLMEQMSNLVSTELDHIQDEEEDAIENWYNQDETTRNQFLHNSEQAALRNRDRYLTFEDVQTMDTYARTINNHKLLSWLPIVVEHDDSFFDYINNRLQHHPTDKYNLLRNLIYHETAIGFITIEPTMRDARIRVAADQLKRLLINRVQNLEAIARDFDL